MTTRNARLEDASAIAAIHVRAWRAAYRGLVPSAFLDGLSIDEREGMWRQRLQHNDSMAIFIAEENGKALGWVTVGPSRDDDAGQGTGELYGLYVAPEHWRHGIGLRLQSAGVQHLRDSGFTEVTLWVLSENSRARAFYRSTGFAVDAGIEKTLQLGGAELLEVRLRIQIGG